MSVYASSYSAGKTYDNANGGILTVKKPFKNADDENQTIATGEYKRGTPDGITIIPANAHLVTFDTDGAGDVAAQVVADGACAQKPTDPSKNGFRFVGWRLVTNGEMSAEDFDFSTSITTDTTLKAFYIDLNEHNGDRYEIQTLDGAPEIDSDNMADAVSKTLTQEELDAEYYLLLVSSPLTDVPAGDKTALEGQAGALGATPGTWFDVSLYKVRGQEQTKLSKAGTPVRIQMTVPESLRKDGRTFYLLRCHDGKATLAAQGTGATLTWETDEFSTYVLAYKDPGTSAPASSTPASSPTSGGSIAKTGDPGSAGTIGILLACAMLALAAGIAVLRRGDERDA